MHVYLFLFLAGSLSVLTQITLAHRRLFSKTPCGPLLGSSEGMMGKKILSNQ